MIYNTFCHVHHSHYHHSLQGKFFLVQTPCRVFQEYQLMTLGSKCLSRNIYVGQKTDCVNFQETKPEAQKKLDKKRAGKQEAKLT